MNPLFSLPDDSVILVWNPGSYHRIFFMFMSQLYPHYKEFQVNKWNIIAFSTETNGAIRRTTVNPLVNLEWFHRIHQLERIIRKIMVLHRKMMLTCHLEVQMTRGNRMVTVIGIWTIQNLDPPQGGQPPFPPHPPPSMPPSMPPVVIPTPQQPRFCNPDEKVEQVAQPVADEDCIKFGRSAHHRARKSRNKAETETCITRFRRETAKGEGKGSDEETESTIARTSESN